MEGAGEVTQGLIPVRDPGREKPERDGHLKEIARVSSSGGSINADARAGPGSIWTYELGDPFPFPRERVERAQGVPNALVPRPLRLPATEG